MTRDELKSVAETLLTQAKAILASPGRELELCNPIPQLREVVDLFVVQNLRSIAGFFQGNASEDVQQFDEAIHQIHLRTRVDGCCPKDTRSPVPSQTPRTAP